MTNPWRFVDADDDSAADFLAGTIDVLLDLDAWIHPQARFTVREGRCSVQCDADDDSPLIALPAEAFLPVGRLHWSDAQDALAFDLDGAGLTDVQTELLLLQVAFHNACAKIPRLVADHPVLAGDLSPDVVDAVRAFRPRFRRARPTPTSLFWSNRTFRLPAGPSAGPEPMALPLIDLLDHRCGGATGTWTGAAFSVDVSHAGGEADCWLDYGVQRDAIGMAVVYGFADASAALAHSAPMDLDVPSLGQVRVLGRGRTVSGELLPAAVVRDGDSWVVSHLTVRDAGGELLVRELRDAAGWSDAQAQEVVAVAAERNRRLLDAIVAAAAGDGSSAAAVLRDAALRQGMVLAAATR